MASGEFACDSALALVTEFSVSGFVGWDLVVKSIVYFFTLRFWDKLCLTGRWT